MKFSFTTFFLCAFAYTFAQTKPVLRYADKIRIREAIHISDRFGNKLFVGFHSVPFAILLVTDSTEFLIHHPNPTSDFKLLGAEEVLKTNIYYRQRTFDKHLLATFPAVNGLSCIVVGTPEHTNKNSSEWIITLLHEHFHQYQNAHPDYFESVNKLDLSGGDQSGMWMLRYAFPYDSLPVVEQYHSFTKALHQTVTRIHSKAFDSCLKQYFIERQKLRNLLSPADYRYFSFQVWQEGLARNTEYAFLKLLAGYVPAKEVRDLPDFVSFSELKEQMYDREINSLINSRLSETRRVCFYSVGFAEGLLLDRLNKHWRKSYLKDKFFLENYFANRNN